MALRSSSRAQQSGPQSSRRLRRGDPDRSPKLVRVTQLMLTAVGPAASCVQPGEGKYMCSAGGSHLEACVMAGGLEEQGEDSERQASGALAGPSGRAHAMPAESAVGGGGGGGAGTGAAAGEGGAGEVLAPAASLAAYLARRGSVVRPADSFRIFCGTLSLLRALHARGATLRRVRPSALRITSSGVRTLFARWPLPCLRGTGPAWEFVGPCFRDSVRSNSYREQCQLSCIVLVMVQPSAAFVELLPWIPLRQHW